MIEARKDLTHVISMVKLLRPDEADAEARLTSSLDEAKRSEDIVQFRLYLLPKECEGPEYRRLPEYVQLKNKINSTSINKLGSGQC